MSVPSDARVIVTPEKWASMKTELASLSSDIDKLRNDLSTSEHECKALQAEVTRLEVERNGLVRQRDDYLNEVKAGDAAFQVAADQLRGVLKERDEAYRRLGEALTALSLEQQKHCDHLKTGGEIKTHLEQIDERNY